MSQENQKALSLTTRNKYLSPTQGGYSLLTSSNEYDQNYVVHRINLPSIEVNAKMRQFIEEAMGSGKKFVRIGDHTVMVNSISGIDPMKRKYKPLGIQELYHPDGVHIVNKVTGEKRKRDEI